MTACAISGCDRPAARNCNSMRVCRLHGNRWSRYGRFHLVKVNAPARPERLECTVDGCVKQDDGPHGLCKMHKARFDRHGDVNVVIPASERDHRGETHHAWTGDQASYIAVHQRVRALRGSASKHSCVDCGGQAKQWSYDHSDVSERISEEGRPYSLNLDCYHARCISCHKRFDLAWLRYVR